MGRKGTFIISAGAAMLTAAVWAGHELPVYPSYYPHEIEIRTLAPERADSALQKGEIQAYAGKGLHFGEAPPEHIRAIESLGSFIVVRTNPHQTAKTSACGLVKAVMNGLGSQSDFVLHPYPVTPLQGDYLYHADLATAAMARWSAIDAGASPPKIRASGRFAGARPDWFAGGPDWDAEIVEVDAAAEMASAMFAVNGRLGPPWLKAGWFYAARLLMDGVEDTARKAQAETDLRRLETGAFDGLPERINLERDLVRVLAGGCRKMIAGYTVKREYVNVEFSAGIENIGYDAIEGIASPMFIRTVKLKDFPWNGWLNIGIAGKAGSAWNPVGGMTDPFGRLMNSAVGDPALLPSPYEAGWMLNRIADLSPARTQ
jgi:hypothetical protein